MAPATAVGDGAEGAGLRGRSSLSDADAADLTRLFKALTNPGRLRILHTLALGGETSVGDLAEASGLTAQATSNQLQRLLDQGFLASRREGTPALYRIADPCVPELLDLGLCLIDETTAREGQDR